LDCASQTYNPQTARAKKILEHVQQTIGDLHNAVLAQYNGTLANEKLDTEKDALEDAYNEVGEFLDAVSECDCGQSGHWDPREYQYFNPSFNYVDKNGHALPENTPEEVCKYVRQDYERMESLNRGDWYFLGISAEAKISVPSGYQTGTLQTITSGGLWGIESDSEDSYLESIEQEELSELRSQLKALGFSSRAISVAFKNTVRKDS
jgi:hypothetical protein